MSRGELKHAGVYWFARIYTAGVLLLWESLIVACLYRVVVFGQESGMLLIGAITPFALPATLAVLNWCAFPFAYSVFGQYKRTEFPKEAVLLKIGGLWIVVSWCFRYKLGVTWYVFPSGVGISMLGIGRVFLPFAEIEEMRKVGRWQYRVSHICPEVRTPIIMPSWVADAILQRNWAPP